MDLYEEKEHVISSDEYSEDDDDDDDALMNDAIRAQNNIKSHLGLNEKPKWRIEQKQKQLSSLIRRNKISIIYKNKSIKWLNSKKQRERYKGHIIRSEHDEKQNKAYITHEESKVISSKEQNATDSCQNSIKKCTTPMLYEATELRKGEFFAPSREFEDTTTTQGNQNKETSQSSQTHIPEKRGRSCSPFANENREEHKCSEKRFKADSPQFYKKINEMFPKFDAIAKDHIEYITNNTLTATQDKMKSIFNEIKTLNDILHTKEMEWNRILHLKMVKEEIYSRLSRKKYVLELNEPLIRTRSPNTLSDLKELELYLSENSPLSPPINTSYSSIQQIIENRANMKAEDLERERNNTSRLHSLLVSRNMLPGVESADNKHCGNGEVNIKSNDAVLQSNVDTYQDLGSKTWLNRGRQGEFKDVKSIIADFRQKHPDILPRNSHYNVCVDDNYNKGNVKRNFEVSSPKNAQYPHCQECKIHESRFVCAGCGNQWYCSKKCQISAWDKHSEICTD